MGLAPLIVYLPSVVLLLLKQTLLLALKKYNYRVVNIWGGSNITTLGLVSFLEQNSLTSHSHLLYMSNRIGSPPIQLKDIVTNMYALQLPRLRIERF